MTETERELLLSIKDTISLIREGMELISSRIDNLEMVFEALNARLNIIKDEIDEIKGENNEKIGNDTEN